MHYSMSYTGKPRLTSISTDIKDNEIRKYADHTVYYVKAGTKEKIKVAENYMDEDYFYFIQDMKNAGNDFSDYLKNNKDKIKNCCLDK